LSRRWQAGTQAFPIYHFGEPADADSLSNLSSLGADALIPFYSQHDGASLFTGRSIVNDFYPALRLYSVREFQAKTKEMQESAIAMGTPEEELYNFQKNGIVFGEICRSGNYFVLSNSAVYYSDHDGGDDSPFATSFPLFFERIAENPPKFLYEAGCYTRYSDGNTRNQWIPEVYLPNTNSI